MKTNKRKSCIKNELTFNFLVVVTLFLLERLILNRNCMICTKNWNEQAVRRFYLVLVRNKIKLLKSITNNARVTGQNYFFFDQKRGNIEWKKERKTREKIKECEFFIKILFLYLIKQIKTDWRLEFILLRKKFGLFIIMIIFFWYFLSKDKLNSVLKYI